MFNNNNSNHSTSYDLLQPEATTSPDTVKAKNLLASDSSPSPRVTPSFILGERCLLGDPEQNFSKNVEKAVFYFNRAIIEKEPYCLLLAVTLLGFCYEFGLGVPCDYKRCEEIYRVSAVENEALAIARLAFLKKYGRTGVNIDRAESEIWNRRLEALGGENMEWLKKAADKFKEKHAQYVMGSCYKDGYGVQRDPSKAFYYFQLSADQGYSRSIGILGFCYGEGLGVEKDQAQALFNEVLDGFAPALQGPGHGKEACAAEDNAGDDENRKADLGHARQDGDNLDGRQVGQP